MASGFIDLSWNQEETTNVYNQDGNSGEQTWTVTTDLYNVLSRPGVYLINGSKGNVTYIKPIPCSFDDLAKLDMVNEGAANDDAYLVYPDYGFKLYQSNNYGGTSSNTYFNTSDVPRMFLLKDVSWTNSNGARVYTNGNQNISGSEYPINSTKSIRIFHRSFNTNSDIYEIRGLGGST